MDWNSKEAGQLFEQWGKSKGEGDDVLAVASLAVRLFIARASGQVREQGESFAKYHDERAGYGGASREFHERAASWCRTVAALVQEAESLRAKVAELEARLRHAEGAEERHKNHAEVASSEVDALTKRLGLGTIQEQHALILSLRAEVEGLKAENRKAIADAAMFARRSMLDESRLAAIRERMGKMARGAAKDELRWLARDTELEGDASTAPTTRCPGTLPECSAGCPWHGVGSSPDKPQDAVKEAMEAAENLAAGERGLQRAHDNGAEAMRAACWEAIKAEFQKHGINHMDTAWKAAKDGVEGAAP